MKTISLSAMLLVALLAPGCSWFKHADKPAAPTMTAPKTIVTPDLSQAAVVVSVNTAGRFVVLNFPAGQMPKVDQTLFLYRGGLKVAELKVTGPQSENNTVADIISGDAKVGDTVRSE